DAGQDGAVPRLQRRDDAAHELGAREAAGGVVDEDGLAPGGDVVERSEAGGDGGLPGGATDDHADGDVAARDATTREQRGHLLEVSVRCGDDDGVDHTGGRQPTRRVDEERGPGERDERLGQGVPQARPGAGSREDRGAEHVGQEARTSSSMASALSSSVRSARASSETRIWRALASMRVSPADRPRSWSRRDRSRTTSATLMTSPEAIFSTFAL